MDFQHSQPQSVYRSKNYLVGWLQVSTQLGLAVFYAFWSLDRPSVWSILAIPLLLGVAVFSGRRNQREKLILSPAGISITSGRSAATPWSNVERLQMISIGKNLRLGEVACLVLRDPSQATLKPVTRGVPDELKGRVMLLNPGQWDRIAELEQELYGYLRANAADQGQLSVPPTLAAVSQHQERLGMWAAAALVLITGVIVYIFVF